MVSIKGILVFLSISLSFFITFNVQARITPEDIVQAKRAAYEKRVASYSAVHKQALIKLSEDIAAVNKKRTDQLDRIMEVQAAILDEYERRENGKDAENIKTARYWVTYAHEAVAYQAAKIYIFDLSSEGNIKSDANSTINLFQSELNSTRSKVIYSQKILQGVVGK